MAGRDKGPFVCLAAAGTAGSARLRILITQKCASVLTLQIDKNPGMELERITQSQPT
jgi:hypothetical protein